jgi:hypothetical protein
MKAGLLLLTIAATIAAASGTAQARHGRGCCGRGYYGGGGGGGYGCYGGSPSNGYAYGTTTANYGPGAQPMMANQMVYGQGGCGNTATTAAYPPSGPMPGTPGGYNGATYENGSPTPTYAPGTNAPPMNAQGNYAPGMNGQRMDNANDHNATMNPTVSGTPQPGSSADTANNHNATAPPPAPASAPAPGSSSSDTANQHNTTP